MQQMDYALLTTKRFRETTWPKYAWLGIAIGLLVMACPAMGQEDDLANMTAINPEIAQAKPIDDERLQANGLSIFKSQHATLYTDLRDQAQCKELLRVFDAAVPQWCDVFDVPLERAKPWRMRIFLVANPADLSRFQKSGLTDNLPQFAAGFQVDEQIWLYAQPYEYYLRHLLLHEGTHAFMQWFTNGYGSPWYSEGIAEQLGLHRWQKGQLALGYLIEANEDVPGWGRPKIIREDRAKQNGMTLDDVLNIPAGSFREVRYYAWSWAGCEFFNRHPITQKDFQQMIKLTSIGPDEFNRRFRSSLVKTLQKNETSWQVLEDDWALFISELDYGYSIEKGILSTAKQKAGVYTIDASRSWQSTRLRVKRGDRLQISASGRYLVGEVTIPAAHSVAEKTYPLNCEPDGITLFHYRGMPLGQLQASVLQDGDTALQRTSGFLTPQSVGRLTTLEIKVDGELFLRINESPAKLRDNLGSLDVRVKRLE